MMKYICWFIQGIEQLMPENWIFILSVAFQMAAAMILLIGMLSKKQVEEQIEKEESVSGIGVGYKSDEEALVIENRGMPDDVKKDRFGNMISNRIAVIYLFVGYLVGIWGENAHSLRMQETVLAIVVFVILCATAGLYVRNRSKKISFQTSK